MNLKNVELNVCSSTEIYGKKFDQNYCLLEVLNVDVLDFFAKIQFCFSPRHLSLTSLRYVFSTINKKSVSRFLWILTDLSINLNRLSAIKIII